MKSTRPRFANLVTAMLYMLTSLSALTCLHARALPDDNQQPIRIQSNSAERDEREGITTYSGQVIITQGSLRIEADQVVIHNKNSEVSNIIATGRPAHLQQQPEKSKAIVHARGNVIRYFIDEEHVQLIDNASLVQEASTVNSDRIDYYINDQKIRAESHRNSKPDQQQTNPTRVEVVIPPKSVIPKNEPPENIPSKNVAPENADPENTPLDKEKP